MRILILHNRYQVRGGEDVAVERDLKLLLSAGHEVHLHEEKNDDIRGFWQKARAGVECVYSHAARKRALALIREFRPNVMHVHNFFPKLTASVLDAARSMSVPVVMSIHNYRLFCINGLFLREGKICEICLPRPSYAGTRYACYRNSHVGSFFVSWMVNQNRLSGVWEEKVDHYVIGSEFAAKKSVEGGIPPQRIQVRPNSAEDLSPFRQADGDYYVFLGRLSPEKGVDTLLKSFSASGIPLKVIGQGEAGSRWQEEYCQRNIEFLGGKSQTEAWNIMGRSRGLVFPSECYEGAFPLAVIEALSMGVPVIASGVGSVRDYLTDRKNALFFQMGNAGDLAVKVASLEDAPGMRAELGSQGREAYLRHFTPGQSLRTLEEVYCRVTGAKA